MWVLQCAEAEVCGAAQHGQGMDARGSHCADAAAPSPLIQRSAAARPPGAADPSLDGKLAHGSLQGVEGKID